MLAIFKRFDDTPSELVYNVINYENLKRCANGRWPNIHLSVPTPMGSQLSITYRRTSISIRGVN